MLEDFATMTGGEQGIAGVEERKHGEGRLDVEEGDLGSRARRDSSEREELEGAEEGRAHGRWLLEDGVEQRAVRRCLREAPVMVGLQSPACDWERRRDAGER